MVGLKPGQGERKNPSVMVYNRIMVGLKRLKKALAILENIVYNRIMVGLKPPGCVQKPGSGNSL